MNFNKNVESIKEAMLAGKEITIRRYKPGAVREPLENCLLVREAADIPEELLADGAVQVIGETTVLMYCAENPVRRDLSKKPIFLRWELAKDEAKDKVPGIYSAWPKDNGATTLDLIDGEWYEKPMALKAALMTEDKVPDFVLKAGFPAEREGSQWVLDRHDWGSDRRRVGTIGKALWVEYGDNDVNILAVTEPAAQQYNVYDADGEFVCKVPELFA